MFRNGGRRFSNVLGVTLCDRGGLSNIYEAEEQHRVRISVGSVTVLNRPVIGSEPGEIDLRGNSMMEGLPEKMTETTRAVSS